MTDEITVKDRIEIAVEAWKKTIEVQEHFNTIEMQIRNLAITVLTASIAAGAVVRNQTEQAVAEASKNGATMPSVETVRVLGLGLSAADIVVLGALIAWLAFYFMDRWWYHRLLKASVEKGAALEKAVADTDYGDLLGLTGHISKGSPFKFFGREVHSEQKIDFFYLLIGFVLVLIILFVF